jgi:rhodanese-related sulfurtransferase
MSVQTITPAEAFALRRRQAGSPEIIDVRTPAEYEQVHAEGARSIPLGDLDARALQPTRSHEPLLVICKSGGRAAKACERLQHAGASNVLSIEGGTDAWIKAGLPVVRTARATISLERQVRIGAGLLVLLGVVLAWHVHPAFNLLSGFIGAGLVFAGVTDWCGMAIVLAKMPWNRATNAAPDDTRVGPS